MKYDFFILKLIYIHSTRNKFDLYKYFNNSQTINLNVNKFNILLPLLGFHKNVHEIFALYTENLTNKYSKLLE